MELTQAQCQLEPRLPVHRGKVSIQNIQMLNAILYVGKHGFKWLGLPKRFRDGTPSAKGNTLMCHQGVDVQCKCTLIICYSTRIRYFDDTRDCAIGGLSADRYFFTLSLCRCSAIPSVLTAKRKCPHYGECDIDAARAGKTSDTQQLTRRVYDNRAGSYLMGVSARHTRRMLAAYREDGAAALAHGNRGRRPANATPSALATDVIRLARSRYAGVNHTHLSELLREREGIDIGRDTLRKILTNAGVNSPRRRRPPKHRVRRQRMPREGMLIQVDGSYHRWLGEDGPQFTLLLAVDDATGVVVNALFCELENTHSYFLLMWGLIRNCGIPIALYADRHAVFKYTPPSEAAAAPTQFSRAMDELGVQLIFARRKPRGGWSVWPAPSRTGS